MILKKDGKNNILVKLMKYIVKKINSPYDGFYMSIRGYSHVIKNTVCQDYSKTYFSNDLAICITADGHGSSKHFRSDKGSKFATFAALESIKAFMKDRENFDNEICENSKKVLKKIESNILYRWNKKVLNHYNSNPLREDELDKLPDCNNIKIESIYGSTLIVGVITPKYWFGMQIGDGSLVTILNDGCTKEFMPIDEKLVANFTTSLCDNDAINNFRDVFSLNVPSALLSSTDGLINSFRDTNSFLRFNKMVITEIKKDKKSKKALKKHLFKRSEDGSLDDISIASVYVKNN